MTPEEQLEAELEKLTLDEQAFIVDLLQKGFMPSHGHGAGAALVLKGSINVLLAVRAGIRPSAGEDVFRNDPRKGYTASNLVAGTPAEHRIRSKSGKKALKGVRRGQGQHYSAEVSPAEELGRPPAYLGMFSTAKEAAQAVDTFICREGFGGYLNFPEEHEDCGDGICKIGVEENRSKMLGTGIVGKRQRHSEGVYSPANITTWMYNINGYGVRQESKGGFLTPEAAVAARAARMDELDAVPRQRGTGDPSLYQASEYTGVVSSKGQTNWRYHFMYKGRHYGKSGFATAEEAHRARKQAISEKAPDKQEPLDPAAKARAIEMRKAGALYKEIAAETGIAKGSLTAILKPLGLEVKPSTRGVFADPSVRDQVIAMRRAGKELGEISKVTGISASNLSHFLLTQGLGRPPGGKSGSGYRGVSWHKSSGKWVAMHKSKYLGLYDDPADAARAYDKAAHALSGGKARLNFPDEHLDCSEGLSAEAEA